MPLKEALAETPERTPACSWCGDPASSIVEVRAHRLEVGRARGEYVGSRTRRMCDRCAIMLTRLVERGPKRKTSSSP